MVKDPNEALGNFSSILNPNSWTPPIFQSPITQFALSKVSKQHVRRKEPEHVRNKEQKRVGYWVCMPPIATSIDLFLQMYNDIKFWVTIVELFMSHSTRFCASSWYFFASSRYFRTWVVLLFSTLLLQIFERGWLDGSLVREWLGGQWGELGFNLHFQKSEMGMEISHFIYLLLISFLTYDMNNLKRKKITKEFMMWKLNALFGKSETDICVDLIVRLNWCQMSKY